MPRVLAIDASLAVYRNCSPTVIIGGRKICSRSARLLVRRRNRGYGCGASCGRCRQAGSALARGSRQRCSSSCPRRSAFLPLPSHLIYAAGGWRPRAALHAPCPCGRRLLIASLALRGDPWSSAGRQGLDAGARAALPALGRVRQSARRHHRIGRRHRSGTLGGARHGLAQRWSRAGHRARGAGAPLPDARIVFTGGSANLDRSPARRNRHSCWTCWRASASRATRVQLEERSRNTVENALFTKALIDPKPGERWLLVTSAMHMPRAVGVFRQAGFPVEAYPVDWHTKGWSDVAEGPVWPVRRVGHDRLRHEGMDWSVRLLAGRLHAGAAARSGARCCDALEASGLSASGGNFLIRRCYPQSSGAARPGRFGFRISRARTDEGVLRCRST